MGERTQNAASFLDVAAKGAASYPALEDGGDFGGSGFCGSVVAREWACELRDPNLSSRFELKLAEKLGFSSTDSEADLQQERPGAWRRPSRQF